MLRGGDLCFTLVPNNGNIAFDEMQNDTEFNHQQLPGGGNNQNNGAIIASLVTFGVVFLLVIGVVVICKIYNKYEKSYNQVNQGSEKGEEDSVDGELKIIDNKLYFISTGRKNTKSSWVAG